MTTMARVRARTQWLVGLALLMAVAVWGLGFHTPPGPRSARAFDPDRLADLELEMWQAYYRKDRTELFADLLIALREQFRYPWAKAASAGFHLARAAATFGDSEGDYQRVLPDL